MKNKKKEGLLNDMSKVFLVICLLPLLAVNTDSLKTYFLGEEIKGTIVRYDEVIESSGKSGTAIYYIPVVTFNGDSKEYQIVAGKNQQMKAHTGEDLEMKYYKDSVYIKGFIYRLEQIASSSTILGIFTLMFLFDLVVVNSDKPYTLRKRGLISLALLLPCISAMAGLLEQIYLKNQLLPFINSPFHVAIGVLTISGFIYSLIRLVETLFLELKGRKINR